MSSLHHENILEDCFEVAMEYYIQYDDEKLDTESLFGGLSVADRVTSINNKIDSILYN